MEIENWMKICNVMEIWLNKKEMKMINGKRIMQFKIVFGWLKFAIIRFVVDDVKIIYRHAKQISSFACSINSKTLYMVEISIDQKIW
jgi:hypothetical protein